MRKFAILAAICLWPLSAAADGNRFYVGVHGGAMIVNDSDISSDTLGSGTIEFDPGFAVGGIFGYKLAQGVRFEGEYTYRRAGVDDVCGGAGCLSSIVDGDGHVSAHAIMANVFYEPRFGNWLPYVGGGAGIGILDAEAEGTFAGGAATVDEGDTVFAYQVGGGIGYAITENHMFSVGYRYWATTDPDFNGVEAEVGTHNILAELRTTF